MDLISQLVFLFGVLFQCIIMMRSFFHKVKLKNIIIGLFIVSIISIISSFESGFETFFISFSLILSFAFVAFYREEITSFLDERIFIFFNLLMIYFLLLTSNSSYQIFIILSSLILIILYFSMQKYKSNFKASRKLFIFGAILFIPFVIFGSIFINFFETNSILLLVLSLFVPIFFLISVISKKVHSYVFQGVSYLWYLVILISIEIFVFLNIFSIYFSGETIPIFIFFFIGSSAVYLISLFLNIILSIPLIGEDTPVEESMKNVYNSMMLFSEKFSDEQASVGIIFLIIILSIILFSFQYFTQVISFEYFVIMIVPILVFIFRIKNSVIISN